MYKIKRFSQRAIAKRLLPKKTYFGRMAAIHGDEIAKEGHRLAKPAKIGKIIEGMGKYAHKNGKRLTPDQTIDYLNV